MRNYSSGAILDQSTLFNALEQGKDSYQTFFSTMLKTADIILPHANELPSGGFLGQYHDSHPVWPFYELLTIMTKNNQTLSRGIYDFFAFQKRAYWNNLFVMRWEYFSQYCEFLFPLLFELEKKINLPEGLYQKRVFAFLSERLLNYWIWRESLNRIEVDWCMTEAVDQGREKHQCNMSK